MLSSIVDLVIGMVQMGSLSHLIAWSLHKRRLPANSPAGAETFAASESVDDIIVLHDAFYGLFDVWIKNYIIVNYKNQIHSLFTPCRSLEKSMRSDINHIQFASETLVDVVAWLGGTLSTAGIGTKFKSL